VTTKNLGPKVTSLSALAGLLKSHLKGTGKARKEIIRSLVLNKALKD